MERDILVGFKIVGPLDGFGINWCQTYGFELHLTCDLNLAFLALKSELRCKAFHYSLVGSC